MPGFDVLTASVLGQFDGDNKGQENVRKKRQTREFSYKKPSGIDRLVR